jgi:hypothetical protein
MDFSQDFIRRQARGVEAAERDAVRTTGAVVDRLVNGDGAELPAEAKSDLLLGGMHRRRFLYLGSAAVATSAVFSACRGATPPVSVVPATTTTSLFHPSTADATILRTASSLEALAVSTYTKVLATGLVKTASTLDLVKLFQMQHSQHGDLFQRGTRNAGGTAFSDPNPVVMAQLVQPRLAALMTEADAVSLAYDLEHLLAASYQADIGTFENHAFNTTTASVGASEARHVALLAVIGGKSATGTPDGAFQVDTDAVKPATGV